MRALATTALLAVLASACSPAPAARSEPPTPAATASSAPSAPATATLSPSTSPRPTNAVSENQVLGYRITLPTTFRLVRATLYTEQTELLGRDTYTTRTEAEERADCLTDGSDIPSPTNAQYMDIEVYRNGGGLSPELWARSRPENQHQTVRPATVGVHNAAELVQAGTVHAYAIAANGRMYFIAVSMWPSPIPLDTIVSSFAAITAQPFPSPSPSPALSRRDATAEVVARLATAFAARDADAVARLVPSCRIAVIPYLGGAPQGSVITRSSAVFIAALRDRFAKGDLTVSVEPALLQDARASDRYFVRSAWREPDRVVRIDLGFDVIDGEMRWTSAVHYYDRLTDAYCIPYRSPWITPTPGGPCSP